MQGCTVSPALFSWWRRDQVCGRFAFLSDSTTALALLPRSTAWPWSRSFSSLGEDSSVSRPGKHLVMEGDTRGRGYLP